MAILTTLDGECSVDILDGATRSIQLSVELNLRECIALIDLHRRQVGLTQTQTEVVGSTLAIEISQTRELKVKRSRFALNLTREALVDDHSIDGNILIVATLEIQVIDLTRNVASHLILIGQTVELHHAIYSTQASHREQMTQIEMRKLHICHE